MPRVMCVWFPRWPIQRLRHARPELDRLEIVLFAGLHQRPVVTFCTSKAERQGIYSGQPLAEARALFPRALILPAESDEDRSALSRLAIEFQRFSPFVGIEDAISPESLLSDVTGCTHLWKGEERFLRSARAYWKKHGYQTQLSLAGSPGAAWALAHSTACALVPAGEEETALSPLSIAALRLPSRVLEPLRTLGLLTIGDLLRLPRDTLAGRFGTILPTRLDQALGNLPETFICERLEEPVTSIREWEVPIDDRFVLGLACREMVRELPAKTEHHGLGFQELAGTLRTEIDSITMEIKLLQPTRDDGHLMELIDLQLERQAWSGSILHVRWEVSRLGRIEQAQGCWFTENAESTSTRLFHGLVERLGSRLGTAAVLRIEFQADAQPENVVRLIPFATRRAPETERFTPSIELARGRPCRLLERPVAIDVVSTAPDGPPIKMAWKRDDWRIVRSWGPERIATGWWRGQDVERDYYRAEWEDGTHVWVYRDQRRARWFLHGFFD